MLVYPKTLFDIIGFALVAVVIVIQWLKGRNEARAAAG
jgi:hypothetical protein